MTMIKCIYRNYFLKIMLSKKCSYDDRPMIPEYIKLASVSLSVFFFQHELHRNAGQHNPKVIGFSV